MHPVSAEELLQRIIIQKIRSEWYLYLEKWKNERWLMIYSRKFGEQPPGTIDQLPQGFFESLAHEVNECIEQKLFIPRKELEKYTTSASSLSRFLGKNQDFHHRFYKKKTGLAIFAGYRDGRYTIENWNDFEIKYQEYCVFVDTWRKQTHHSFLIEPQSISDQVQPAIVEMPADRQLIFTLIHQAFATPPQSIHAKKINSSWMIAAIALVGVLLAGGYWFMSADKPLYHGESVLEVLKVNAGENIATVLIRYAVPKAKDDTVRLFFGDYNASDPVKIISTKPSDTILIMVYKPFIKAKLFLNKTFLKQINIEVPTHQWVGWAYTNQNGIELTATHNECELIENNALTFPAYHLPEHFRSYYFTSMYNVGNFQTSLTDCEIAARVKLDHKPEKASCNHLVLRVCNEIDQCVSYPVELSGCEYWLWKVHDIEESEIDSTMITASHFTHEQRELESWNIIRMRIQKGEVTYWWNDTEVGTRPIPDYTGTTISLINFESKGSWLIDSITVINAAGEMRYRAFFDDCP